MIPVRKGEDKSVKRTCGAAWNSIYVDPERVERSYRLYKRRVLPLNYGSNNSGQ